jgi:predicted small lipoprotein YifL
MPPHTDLATIMRHLHFVVAVLLTSSLVGCGSKGRSANPDGSSSCGPDEAHFVPGCGPADVTALPGCYHPCDGAGAACPGELECKRTNVNPCAEQSPGCERCGQIIWLCM